MVQIIVRHETVTAIIMIRTFQQYGLHRIQVVYHQIDGIVYRRAVGIGRTAISLDLNRLDDNIAQVVTGGWAGKLRINRKTLSPRLP